MGPRNAVTQESVVNLCEALLDVDLSSSVDDIVKYCARLGLSGEQVHQVTTARKNLDSKVERLIAHERQMTSLFQSAREIAESKDREMTISRLVRRARELLQGDLAYLSEFDPVERDLDVLSCDGAMTLAFSTIHVPSGIGLASEIALSRSPKATADYFSLEETPRDTAIDSAIRGEGLVAIAGVPLLTYDNVIGVLFVGYRYHRTVSANELAVLSALADLASAVLQNCQAVEDARTAETQAKAVSELYAKQLAERDKANVVHKSLIDSVLRGGGLASIAAALAKTLQCDVAIGNTYGETTSATSRPSDSATSNEIWTGFFDNPQFAHALQESTASGRCTALPGLHNSAYCVAIGTSARRYGMIALSHVPQALSEVEVRLVERAAHVAAIIYLQESVDANLVQRSKNHLFESVLHMEHSSVDAVTSRMLTHGISLETNTSLTVALISAPVKDRIKYVLQSPQLNGVFHAHVGDDLFALVPPKWLKPFENAMSQIPGNQFFLAEVTGKNPSRFRDAADGLKRLQLLAQDLALDTAVLRLRDHEPFIAALDTQNGSATRYVLDTLRPLLEFDQAQHSSLLDTLIQFYKSNGNAAKVARVMHFHVNTIDQRLKKIDSLLGKKWRTGHEGFRIHFATMLYSFNPQHFHHHFMN